MASEQKTEQKILTKKQVAAKIVEKHQRLMEKNSREFELLHRLFVLTEKQDLIGHWIKDAEQSDSQKKLKEYMKQKKANEEELDKIRAELSSSFPLSGQSLRQRYDFLKKHIDSHKAAIEYWKICQNE